MVLESLYDKAQKRAQDTEDEFRRRGKIPKIAFLVYFRSFEPSEKCHDPQLKYEKWDCMIFGIVPSWSNHSSISDRFIQPIRNVLGVNTNPTLTLNLKKNVK